VAAQNLGTDLLALAEQVHDALASTRAAPGLRFAVRASQDPLTSNSADLLGTGLADLSRVCTYFEGALITGAAAAGIERANSRRGLTARLRRRLGASLSTPHAVLFHGERLYVCAQGEWMAVSPHLRDISHERHHLNDPVWPLDALMAAANDALEIRSACAGYVECVLRLDPALTLLPAGVAEKLAANPDRAYLPTLIWIEDGRVARAAFRLGALLGESGSTWHIADSLHPAHNVEVLGRLC
jgi:hypothetical protein